MTTTKTFVNYLISAGFFPEDDIYEVTSRDPQLAKANLPHRAFAYYFFDQTSTEQDGEILTGKPKNQSGLFYPDAKIWTVEELKQAGHENDGTCLYANAVSNGWTMVKCNLGNWQPFRENDQLV